MPNFRLLGVIYRRKSLFSNKISFKEIMKNNVNNFILRHDVDSPFVYRKSITKKLMNKIFLLKPEIPGKEKLPGYLEALKYLLKLEKKFDAKGTFFFRTVTCPSHDLATKMISDGHELAYHADRINAFQDFVDDFNFLKTKTNRSMAGFTKHGFAKVRSGGIWNEKKMIEYAKSANMKYLAQGVDHPEWEEPRKFDGVFVFGHHLTVKDSSVDELKEYVETHKWPLLLLHPEDLFIEGVEKKFIEILKNYNAISVIDALTQMSR